MFKELSGLGALFKQAQEAGSRFRELGDQLRTRRVTGTAGGGMVEIHMNGLVEVLQCRIDPTLLRQTDRELLEDLLTAAINQAIGKAKQLHAETARTLTSGLPLPGLEQALGKFFGTAAESDEAGHKPGGQSEAAAEAKEADRRGGTE